MRSLPLLALLLLAFILPRAGYAQNYKLRQVTTMMGMKSESTVFVKGMRKRTESSGMMGMGASTSIEQCDLKRTVHLNDKKKLYFIEPFSDPNDEIIDEDNQKNQKMVVPTKVIANKKGGIIYMWYNINDTGERKKMFGQTARHVWTSQKMKPSADACMMKDSFMIRTDGWYIDLPQFNCPVQYRNTRMRQPNQKVDIECMDRFVTRRSGKGKLGFPLVETTTMIMGAQQTEMTTTVETIDFSTAKLDSMLFEIPPGYALAKSAEELQEMPDFKGMMKDVMKDGNQNRQERPAENNEVDPRLKKPGVIRIGVYLPSGDDKISPAVIQRHVLETLTSGKVEAIAVATEDEARQLNCDYSLTSVFTSIKPSSKMGNVLKVIKNSDLNAATFNVQANMTLKSLADGSVKSQPSVDGKFDGTVDNAAGKALDEGCKQIGKIFRQ